MAHPFPVASATTETLSGTRTITAAEVKESTIFVFDPGGAGRNVDIPAASAANAGSFLVIANAADAAEVLTVREGGSTTVVTPTQAETAILFSTGSKWYGIAGANS